MLPALSPYPWVHLYLVFEKSSLKNRVWRTGFLTCKKKQFWNWFLYDTQVVKIQFIELDFSSLLFLHEISDSNSNFWSKSVFLHQGYDFGLKLQNKPHIYTWADKDPSIKYSSLNLIFPTWFFENLGVCKFIIIVWNLWFKFKFLPVYD